MMMSGPGENALKAREVQADPVVHLNLADAGEVVLDGSSVLMFETLLSLR